nr:RNA-directed DNA polymerase, eukaryota, reverse transcriptase zinc-binding domain protein [Tanacetum cinerariifolium]
NRRSVQYEVLKVFTSVFITNFPDQAGAKELWNACKQYGHVVDAFIPDRRSKIGKRFGFVCFIKVFDAGRLVNNLCTVWIGSHRLHANIARFQRPTGQNSSSHNGEKRKDDKGNNGNFNSNAHVLKGVSHPNGDTTNTPSLVIGDDCVNQEDYSYCLNGKVKKFGSLSNLKVVLASLKMIFFGGVDKPNTDNSEEEFEDENVVPDAVFDDGSVKPSVVKNSSGNQGKKNKDSNCSESLKFPPGFTPSVEKEVGCNMDKQELNCDNLNGGARANAFNSFIIQAGLEEIPLGGCSFTWCHKSGSKMSKLDRFFVSDSLLSVCPTLSSITLDRFLSDHRPILLRESTYDYGPSPFRFFKYWAEADGFEKLIVETWSDTAACGSNDMLNLMYKLKNLKKNIRGWNSMRQSFKNYKIMLKSKLADVELVIDKGNASEEVIYKHLEMVNSINELEKQQAMEMAQKAKIKWAIEDDENSKYYHGILNKKRNNLAIRRRMDMEADVTIEEIKNAVWDCETDKPPGLDGFSFDFYRRFWFVIQKDVVAAVKCFFHYGSIPKGCNSSFIALIPKIPDAKMVKDFRLISLIGSLYKIIAKILANRLVTVLGDVINEIQSAFVADRQILDGPFILNEDLQWCKLKKKQSFIFKIDFEKAYDSVR